MKERFIKILSSIFTVLILFGCKKENAKPIIKDSKTFEWRSSICGPAHYRVYGPHVYYFSKGREINATSALLGMSQSWCSGEAEVNPLRNNVLPDSVFISYAGLNDKNETWIFEGGHKLPTTKMKKLFVSGYVENNESKSFEKIAIGMAPGGKICIWVDHIEILRFTINSIKKWKDAPLEYSTIPEHNIDDSLYLKHHPIKYSNWESADNLYELGFGFCSEYNKSDFINFSSYTKEGLVYHVPRSDVDFTDWQIPYGEQSSYSHFENYQQFDDFKIRNTKLFLPVHVYVQWVNQGKYYSSDVVFPKDLSQKFNNSYINPKTDKQEHYNRITFGVEKDGEHCVVWLDGPGRLEKIMRFKGIPEKMQKEKGSYAAEVVYF